MKVAAKKPRLRPEHAETEPDVQLEVRHEEALGEVVGEAVLAVEVPDEAEEAVVGLPGLVREQGDHAGHVDAAQQGDQDEGLENKDYISGVKVTVRYECEKITW